MSILTVKDFRSEKELPVWGLDFETFYEIGKKGKYSLGNPQLKTLGYVRDERFKAHGVAVSEPDGFSYWVTHKDLPAFFASVDWTEVATLSHNAYFDGLIAREHYNVLPALFLDTLSMSLGEWGPGLRHNQDSLSLRLGTTPKIKETLAKTAGIRDLPAK